MTRRKGEITARMNERDAPHIVELALPSGGFGPRSTLCTIFIACAAFQAGRVAGSGATNRNTFASLILLTLPRSLTGSAAALFQPEVDERSARPPR